MACTIREAPSNQRIIGQRRQGTAIGAQVKTRGVALVGLHAETNPGRITGFLRVTHVTNLQIRELSEV